MRGNTGCTGRYRTAFQKTLFVTLLAATSTFVLAATTNTQSLSPKAFSESISEHVSEQHFDKAWDLVKERERATPDDPDLAVVKANLIISSPDAKPRIVIEQYTTGTEEVPDNVKNPVQISNAETSEPAGFIGEFIPEGRDAAIKQAREILAAAVKQHPDRLDIRMGISQLHSLKEDYQAVYENLEKTLDYSSEKNYTGLLWAFNTPAEDPEQKLKDALHQYYSAYTRRTENPEDALAFKFAQASTKYFPNDIRGWNNLAAEYAQQKKQDKAIECLLRAHELDKRDAIIILNIATLYREQKNYKDATRFYNKAIELKDKEYSEAAQQELDSMKEEQK